MPFNLLMPKLSPTMEEGTIAKWHKKVGDFAAEGDVILEITTDKATLEHVALDAGYLRKIVQNEGEKVKVNELIAIFSEDPKENIDTVVVPQQQVKPVAAAIKEPVLRSAPAEDKEKRLLVSPLARNIAKERGIDLEEIKGSGPRGRILSRDLSQAPVPVKERPSLAPQPKPAPITPQESFEDVPFTPMRQAIAERLLYSKTHIPHFYIGVDVNATELMKIKADLKKLEVSYTINDFIIKATARALEMHPQVNSSYNEEKNSTRLFSNVDIAVAVSVPNGLITPIVRRANTKTVEQLSKEMKDLAGRAREGKLLPQEYQGGSFTISNLGMYGIDQFLAIVNPPQSAILSVGAVKKKPVCVDDAIVAQETLHLTLSCDHRVVDGALAAEFMKTLRKLLENPILFLT